MLYRAAILKKNSILRITANLVKTVTDISSNMTLENSPAFKANLNGVKRRKGILLYEGMKKRMGQRLFGKFITIKKGVNYVADIFSSNDRRN
ncbi:MAG: hypothetical protein U0586_05160 [Candidatus Brocadiaceae bacterium]